MTITADLEASTYFVQIIRNCANRVKGGGCYFCDDITDIAAFVNYSAAFDDSFSFYDDISRIR